MKKRKKRIEKGNGEKGGFFEPGAHVWGRTQGGEVFPMTISGEGWNWRGTVGKKREQERRRERGIKRITSKTAPVGAVKRKNGFKEETKEKKVEKRKKGKKGG